MNSQKYLYTVTLCRKFTLILTLANLFQGKYRTGKSLLVNRMLLDIKGGGALGFRV
jgi:hypothetical protein